MSNQDFALMESVLVGKADPEIVALEAQIRAAQLTGDIDALGNLIGDDSVASCPARG